MTQHDYTSASAGKFSECLFRSCQSSHANGGRAVGLSASASASSIHNLERPLFNSSNSFLNPSFGPRPGSSRSRVHDRTRSFEGHLKNDDKRLVHQFLNFDEETEAKSDIQVSLLSAQSSLYGASQGESLSRLMLFDLKDPAVIRENCHSAQPGNKSTVLPQQYFANELSKFDHYIRDLMASISSDESRITKTRTELDDLQQHIREAKSVIKDIDRCIQDQDIKMLRKSFESEDESSFISRFSAAIATYSESLASFEKRIGKCKVDLTTQKATVHKLETTIKLNEMIQDSQSNMCFLDRIREYKGLIYDFCALILLIALIVVLKRYFAACSK